MNKQELIEKYQQIYEVSNNTDFGLDPFSRGEDAGSSRCSFEIVEDLKKLDEPQKVKVPAFVAEWIELCKEKADASSCLNGYYEIGNGTIVRPRGFSEVFYDWLADCDHMDDLARAWLDGYEVDEERKFEVIFPNLTGEKDLYLMKFYEKLSITSDRNFYVDQRYIFTEQEIKSIDERYWAFAVPVEKLAID